MTLTFPALYLIVSVIGTLVYAVGAFAVFGDPGAATAHRWHQRWFNAVGAAVGWLAGWAVLSRWLIVSERPTFATIALLLLAFIGVTGHLPMVFMYSRWRRSLPGEPEAPAQRRLTPVHSDIR